MASQELEDKAIQTKNRFALLKTTGLQLADFIDVEGNAAQKLGWAEVMAMLDATHQKAREFGEANLPGIFPQGGSS